MAKIVHYSKKNKKRLFIIGTLFFTLIAASLLFFVRLTYTGKASSGAITVQVSKDGINYSESVEIPQGEGYYLKTNPPIDGYLEARSPKTDGTYRTFKWSEPLGAIMGENGVFHITGEQLSSLSPGTYVGEFRPWVEGGSTTPWSNKIQIQIAGALGSETPQLKVMSFNVYYGASNQREKMEKLAQHLKDNNVDIVGLQEINMRNANNVLMLTEALNAIGYPMPYVAQESADGKSFISAVFSKYKISDVNPIRARGNRTILEMKIETPLGTYIVANHHVTTQDRCGSINNDSIPYLTKKQKENKNIILFGDFNENLASGCQQTILIDNFYLSCYNESGAKTCTEDTWTSPSGGAMIDYVVLGKQGDTTIASTTVDTSLGYSYSDHRPVISTLRPKASSSSCTSWETVQINNCGYDEYFNNPRSPQCITENNTVTLNLNAPWAKTFRWAEVDRNLFCSEQDDSTWKEEVYAPEKTVTVSGGFGEKKICVRFYSETQKSPVCGGIIQYGKSEATPTTSKLSVVSFNMMAASKAKNMIPALEAMSASMNEGHRWDLVGLQELAEFPLEGISKIKDFKDYFAAKGITYYCETQRLPHWLFKTSLCSRYPIVPNSYKEYRIFTYRTSDKGSKEKHARILHCALIKAPVGEVIFCNTHTQASAVGEQKGPIKDLLLYVIPKDYIPASAVTQQEKNEWIEKNKKRIIMTGDFNSIPTEYIPGIVQACDKNKNLCSDPYYIDHVIFFNKDIVVDSVFRDISKNWQSDHKGPVIAELTFPSGEKVKDSVITTAPPQATPTPNRTNGTLGVVSFNTLKDNKNTRSYESISQSIARGDKWDIIGFQEMGEQNKNRPSREDSKEFIEYMKQKGITYSCEKQREPNVNFSNVICSRFPIKPNSYVEFVIAPGRVLQCIETATPYGDIIACNTHVQVKDRIQEQFNEITRLVHGDIAYRYIPGSVPQQQRKAYAEKNAQRTVVTGDFNAPPNFGLLASACDKNKDACSVGWHFIDYVLYKKGQTVLVPQKAYKDTSLNWDTDHKGPVLTEFKVAM